MRALVVTLAIPILLQSALHGQARAEYIGGTATQIQTGREGYIELTDERYLAFYGKNTQVRVPYANINLLEYGQQVDRRLALAVVISPVFLLSKKRKHFLTIGYQGDDGKQEALVFQVDKRSVRSMLASLEARTGLKIEYQDEEARKAGKG